jgi:hypothetical protein
MSRNNNGGNSGGRPTPQPAITTIAPSRGGVQGGYTPSTGSGAPASTPNTGSGGKK